MLAHSEMIYCLNENLHALWNDDVLLGLLNDVSHAYSASDIQQSIKSIKTLLEHKTAFGAQNELKQQIIKLTNHIKEVKPTENTLPSGQLWYIKIMLKAGYLESSAVADAPTGRCYGIVALAEQAFLANDMSTFNRRLNTIHKLDPDQIKEHLDDLPTKERIDLLAFFDGVQFNQETTIYRKLFEVQIRQQNARVTMPITRSLVADLPESQPATISAFSGAYDPKELLQYLTLLEKHLGAYTFTLKLGSAGHEIGLFYNHKTQRWLLVNPDHLPGEEYIHAELLRDALLSSFFKQMSGLVMVTDLDATLEFKEQIDACFLQMTQSEDWKQLHCVTKLNRIYEDKNLLFNTAIRNGEEQWVENALAISTNVIQKNDYAMGAAIASNNIGMVQILIEHGFHVDHALLLACDTIKDWLDPSIADCLSAHCSDDELCIYACIKKSIPLLERLVLKAFTPSSDTLNKIWHTENPDLMEFFKKNNWFPSQKEFEQLIKSCYPSSINYLLEQGCTLPDLSQTWHEANISVLEFLIEKQLWHPTQDMLLDACIHDRPDMVRFLMDKLHAKPSETMLEEVCTLTNRTNIVNVFLTSGVKPTDEMINRLFQKFCLEKDGEKMEIIALLAKSINFVPNTEMIEHAVDTARYDDLLTLFISHGGHTTDKMLNAVCTAHVLTIFFHERTLNLLLSHGACITSDLFDSICERNDDELTHFFSEKLIRSFFNETELNESEKTRLNLKIEQWVSAFTIDSDATKRDYNALCQQVLSDLKINGIIHKGKLSAIIANLEDKINNSTHHLTSQP